MKKSIKGLIIGGLAVLLVPLAVGSCVGGSAHADDVGGQQIIEDTRYSPIGIAPVGPLVGLLADIANEVIPDSSLEDIADSAIGLFAQKFAELNAKGLEGKAQNYTILDTFSLMGKRRINYPNGDYELQTSYVFIDKNNINTSPQQFGEFTIAPNTIFVVRQCSWGDTHAFSVPIGTNGFTDWNYNTFNGFFEIELSNNNGTFIYDVPEGRQTVGFRHGSSTTREAWKNNTVNTIVLNHLVDAFNENEGRYNRFIEDYHLDDLEAFLGTGYNYDYSVGFLTDLPPWYITTAYFNTNSDYFLQSIQNNFNTDPTAPIDPSKPPAYVLPNNTPISKGTQIDNDNDYGMTIIDGELHIDPDILAGALAPLINPDFNGLLGGVFDAQPQIGLGFDTPLDLNLPDLVGDYLESITVYPPSTRPKVPLVTTFSEWNYLPSYTTQTFPVGVQEGAQVLSDNLTGFTDAMGITSILLILALIGLFTYCMF